jgi:hypothetical protein
MPSLARAHLVTTPPDTRLSPEAAEMFAATAAEMFAAAAATAAVMW